MNKLRKTLIAAAIGVAAGNVQAMPTFGGDVNSIFYTNLENQYRSTLACGIIGGCAAAALDDPAGFRRVDISIPGNVAPGDVFAGVIRVQSIFSATTSWFESGTDQFSGYFAQEVAAVGPVGPAAMITFTNPTVDPFGILAAGEMFRLYTQSGGGTTTFSLSTGGATSSVIGLATDGVFWGSLGVTVGEGYAYAIDDLTAPGTQTTTESFLATDIVVKGPSYNAGDLRLVNDLNESIVGGITAGLVCSAAELAAVGISCTNIVGTNEVERNDFGRNFGTVPASIRVSPFDFVSNDPVTLSIPEPGTIALLGGSLLGLAALRRRKV